MTEGCPGYDGDGRMCLLGPDDCELSPAKGDAAARPEAPVASSPDDSAEAVSR